MGASTMDSMELQIAADARSANAQLDSLINKLTSVSGALQNVNSGGLQGLANGVRTLSSAMSQMKGISTPDFTRLSKNITKLSGIDVSKMNKTASAMNIMGKSLDKLAGVSQSAIQIGDIAKNIAKLGYKSVDNAINNMPKLATAMNEMMASLSKAPMVSQNLIQMTTALAGLASSGSKVGSATRSITSSLLTYSSGTSRATSKTHSFAWALGKLYANFWILIRAFRWFSSAVTSSMDFLETVNYYNVALQQIGEDNKQFWKQNGYDSAEEYANSFTTRLDGLNEKMTGFSVDQNGNMQSTGLKSLGLDSDAVMNAEATFAQMANSMGVVGNSAINVSKAFTMLGADWSSLKNISLDSAWEKFASALAGQSRAVRSLGIDITNTTLQEYAYKYGLTQSISEMNQATKTQLRLLAILDQSKVAFGDLANTMASPANQLRLLKQNFTILARTIGNLFLPIIQSVLPYINAMVIALQSLFSWVGGLLGINMSQINSSIGSASGGVGDIANDLDDADTGMSDLSDDASSAGSNIDDADKAAKKLKRTIMGFDEINALNDATTTSSSSSGSGSGSTGTGTGGSGLLDNEIASALAEYDKAWNAAFLKMDNKAQRMASSIVNAFKKHDYTAIGTYVGNGISGALEKINWKKVYKTASTFGTGFAQFLNGLLTPKLFSSVGKTVAGSLNTAINTAFSFGNTLKWGEIGKAIASGINTFFETFDFKTFGKTINTWVHGIFDLIKSTIKNIKWDEVFSGIVDTLSELDLGTISLLVSWYLFGKVYKLLTSKIFKEAILKQLLGDAAKTGAAGTLSSLGTAAGSAIAIGLMMYVGIQFADDAKEWWDYIQKYGWDEGRKKIADENPANPYKNGTAVHQEGESQSTWAENPYTNGTVTVKPAFGLKKSDVEGWWKKVKEFWGERYTSTKSKFQTTKENVLSWWYDKVEPWWGEKKLNVSNRFTSVKSDIQSWWKDKVKPWWGEKKLDVSNNFSTTKKKVSDWFDDVKGWWDDDAKDGLKIKAAFSTAETVVKKWATDISYWWDKHKPSLKINFKEINLHVTYKTAGLNAAQKAIVKALGLDGWPSLKMYKNGGFPEDGLFMANSTELVGRFTNGKTAVANNGQILEGIRQATYDGYAAALAVNGGSSNQTPVIENTVKLNDEVIYKASQRGEKAYNKRYKTVCPVT